MAEMKSFIHSFITDLRNCSAILWLSVKFDLESLSLSGECLRKSSNILEVKIWLLEITGSPGGRLNIKMSYYQYRDPHDKDKAFLQPSYL